MRIPYPHAHRMALLDGLICIRFEGPEPLRSQFSREESDPAVDGYILQKLMVARGRFESRLEFILKIHHPPMSNHNGAQASEACDKGSNPASRITC